MKKITILVVGVCTMLSAMCGMPVNQKLPMSFGVNSKGGNRFVGEFKDIRLSFGGKTYHAGPAKTGDRVKPFPTVADAEKGMRFACRFVTKNAAAAQRLLDNVTPGKGDGFLIDIYKGRFRAVIGGVCSWSHPVPIQTGRETIVEINVSASDEVTMSVDGDTRKVPPDGGFVPSWQSVKRVENKAPHPDATWKIRFREPAVWSLKGWQRRSLSFGNGYFGVSEFGGTDVERLQLTEPTFHTQQKHPSSRWVQGNLTDSADLFVEFGHKNATDYVREMDLEDALVTVKYKAGGVDYAREYFTSYPDKVGAMRFTASKKGALSFTLRAQVPFLDAKPPMDRTGKVEATGNEIALSEKSGAYGVKLAGRFKVLTDGTVERRDGGALAVANATEATVVYTLATNYRFVPEMFEASKGQGSDKNYDRTPYLGPDPSAEVERRIAAASALGYDELKKRHLADFRGLVGRSSIDIDFDAADMSLTTPELRALGGNSVYLQQLYWRLGKFLLASSSRPGTLPGSLQGCWSGPVLTTAWGSGFWHNINVQMDYWGAFSCNMAECMEAYAAFNAAFRSTTRTAARNYIRRVNPAGLKEPFTDDLWSVGTAAWPYQVSGAPGGHSGPGTGGFTTALYIDWYDFTQDRDVLEKQCWPVLRGMADFLSRCVVETNGLYLSKFSASPEQIRKRGGYYNTTGCAFDQQMILLNNAAFVRFAKLLGREGDPVVKRCKEQLAKYDPVQVGESGQIKEFREERFYGDFVREKHHRHISHLVGVYPGAIINRTTPDWLKAASRTLDLRGEMTTAWALVHRACCRTRTGEGDAAVRLFGNLMEAKTADTLWSIAHGVHIIDANYAGAALFAELVLQSHELDEKGNFVIDLLPALPSAWAKHGSFRGLCARGGWEVDCEWRDGKPVKVNLRPGPHAGPRPLVRFGGKPFDSNSNREPTPGTVAVNPSVYNVLWWLKAHQQKNGSWNDGPCPVASTSLAVCAMLSCGEYPDSFSPYKKDFRDMFILAAEYLLGCVSVTNGVVHVLGSDQDERALPLVTKALCDIYGITHNPNFKEHAAACLRQLAIATRALLASGAWSGKEDVLLWSAEALSAGKWSRCSEDLSREDINKLCGEISEATFGMNDNGYHGGVKRFRAWMRRGATAKDYEAYRDWMKSKKASFIKSCKEEPPAVADTKGVLHRKFFLSESIDAKSSGLGVSADSALSVMELMIGGGGMRNLPIIEESSDNAQPTNDDVSVSVEI